MAAAVAPSPTSQSSPHLTMSNPANTPVSQSHQFIAAMAATTVGGAGISPSTPHWVDSQIAMCMAAKSF
jgi:hypothetical protein